MTINYFGATSLESEPDWQEKWDHPQRLPLLVRIQVELDSGRSWPDLVAPLIVEKGCPIWDVLHKRCINVN